jgi:hypothetical protein
VQNKGNDIFHAAEGQCSLVKAATGNHLLPLGDYEFATHTLDPAGEYCGISIQAAGDCRLDKTPYYGNGFYCHQSQKKSYKILHLVA